MNEILEGLYNNNHALLIHRLNQDKVYSRTANQVKQYSKQFLEHLPLDYANTLEKLLASYDKKNERENIYSFIDGFKIGMTIAIQSLK